MPLIKGSRLHGDLQGSLCGSGAVVSRCLGGRAPTALLGGKAPARRRQWLPHGQGVGQGTDGPDGHLSKDRRSDPC